MESGQDKSALIFKHLIAIDKNTDGWAIQIGDFLQIQNKFMEPSFPVRFYKQAHVMEIVNIQLPCQINDDGVFFIPAINIDFSHQP